MDNKQKILDLVHNSPLSDEDKKEWKALANSSPEVSLESIAILLESLPEELGWFTDILKRKKEAFLALKEDKEKGEKMLQAIYQEERKKIEGWSNKLK